MESPNSMCIQEEWCIWNDSKEGACHVGVVALPP
jgi:hypothetical protein